VALAVQHSAICATSWEGRQALRSLPVTGLGELTGRPVRGTRRKAEPVDDCRYRSAI
jgi:hypothetical protein